MKPLIALTIAATKRYLRNVSSWLASLLIPLVLIFVFGLLSTNNSKINIGIDNQAQNNVSQALVNTIKCSGMECTNAAIENSPFNVVEKNRSELESSISKNQLSAALIIPSDFDGTKKLNLLILKNQNKQQEASTTELILTNIVDNTFNINQKDKKIGVEPITFASKNLTLIDTLIPGIVAISIMNLGLFAVAFAFVSQKTTGILRRLLASPIGGVEIILSEGFSKLLISVLQVFLFLYIGSSFFHLKIHGSLLLVVLLTILGSIVFLSIGFGIAGYAKDENQAAPFAQLLNLPLTFLSGAFFPRDIFPSWLRTITDFLPITYLSDGLKMVINDGAGIFEIRGQILGLLIWGIIVFLIAFKVFRWK